MIEENDDLESCDEPASIDEPLPAPCPASGSERLASIDTLRGIAVLGILGMNIYAFALPYMAYDNPTVMGGFAGPDRLAWWITYMVFNFKMMPIFSMLFGAGLMLMHERYTPKGISFKRFWYRRILLLMLFGVIHGYLIWHGDILFLYSFCGLLLYLFRKKTARKLFIAASIFFVIGFLPSLAGGYYFGMIRDDILPEVKRKVEAGEKLTASEEAHKNAWDETIMHFDPSEEVLGKDLSAMRGGYTDVLKYRAPLYLAISSYLMVVGAFWPAMGLMLFGMALMKLGIFSASRSKQFYMRLAVIGYGAGLPLAYLSARFAIANDFAFVESMAVRGPLNTLAGPLVALGHVGLVMLACKAGIFSGLRRMLAAAGRMAFSNYIGQSLICTTIFYGYGMGLYGSYSRATLMILVLSIWSVELVISTIWLGRFRYGPLEWLWRTLTYGRVQPMRKQSSD